MNRRLLSICALSFVLGGALVLGTPPANASEPPPFSPERIDRMAELSYLPERYDETQVGPWTRTRYSLDLVGARAVVFERRDANGRLERVIVFIGTQPPDWRNNRLEYLASPFPAENQENLQSYAQAQAFSKGVIELARKDRAEVSFVGYSRGALLAQAMAGVFDREAITFNGAPLATGRTYLTREQLETSRRRVTDVHLSFEPVLGTFALPWARDAGATWVVDRSAETNRLIADYGRRGGAAAAIAASHGLEALRLSMKAPHASFTEVVPVDWDTVNLMTGQLLVAGEGFRRIAEHKGFDRLAEGLDRALKPVAAAQELYGLAAALKTDMDAARGHSFVLLKSKTLESIGATLITGTDLPGLRHTPIGSGALVNLANWLEKNGNLSARAGGKITKAPTFGALEFLGAARDVAVDRRASIDTYERLLDGAVGATWAFLGLVVGRGDLATAQHFESAGLVLAQTGRYLMKESGLDRSVLRTFDPTYALQESTLTEQYAQAVNRMRQRGQTPPPPEEFFGGRGPGAGVRAQEILRASGFTAGGIALLHRIYDAAPPARATDALKPAAPARPAEAVGEVGGGDMRQSVSEDSFRQAPAGSLKDFSDAARRGTSGRR